MILVFVLLGLCTSTLGQLVSNSPCPDKNGKPRVKELGDKWDKNHFCTNVVDKCLSLVLFYDPLCKNCPKEMFDEFEKAACVLDKEGIQLAKVNCFTTGALTCYQMKISYYPHFMVFRAGWTPLEYLGPRKADRFINFMHAVKKVPFGKEYLLDEARFPGEAIRRLGLGKRSDVAYVAPSNPCNSKHPPPPPLQMDKKKQQF